MSARLIRFNNLRDHGIPYTRTHINRLISAGRFPRPIKLQEGSRGYVAFVATEVDRWIDARIAERDAQADA